MMNQIRNKKAGWGLAATATLIGLFLVGLPATGSADLSETNYFDPFVMGEDGTDVGAQYIAANSIKTSGSGFSGVGSGTETDPYVITDVFQLQEMIYDLTAHYVLANDIDATVTAGWNGGYGFIPVGSLSSPFTGTFDGQGYQIFKLHIYRPGGRTIGLFGRTGVQSIIRNVGMVNAYVSSMDWVGSLVGWNDGAVSNCWCSGDVYGGGSFGGLVGTNYGSISRCFSAANVRSGNHLGGLAGVNAPFTGRISDCYATGIVSGNENPGGLVGVHYALIENCYATGDVLTTRS